jgi:hypothetical protein
MLGKTGSIKTLFGDDENTEKRSSQPRPSMVEPVIKSVADATSDEEAGNGHGKPGMEAVMGDTSDVVNVVLFNTEYEADIMDEANVVRKRVNRGAWEDRLNQVTDGYDDDEDENNVEIRSSQSRTAMESGNGKGYEEPGMKTAMVDIHNVVMSNMEYEANIIDATTLNSEYEAASRATKAGSST